MVESIRYLKQPTLREKGLKIIIIVIVRDCIENDKEGETMDRLIGNEELIRYGYILEDWDVNIRFGEFYEWYKETIPQAINYKDGTIRRYKNILYEEAELKEDESEEKIETFKQKIKLMLHTMDHERGWIVRKEVIEKVYDKIRRLEDGNETDSDDTPKSYIITETDDEDEEGLSENENERMLDIGKEIQRILKELNPEMDERKLDQLLGWGLTHGEIRNKKLITKYIGLISEYMRGEPDQERLDEIKEEIIQYTIDERKEEVSELWDYAKENEIEISERELTKLWNMGYEGGEIFEEGFLERFHEVKDGLEHTIKKELRLWKEGKEEDVEIDEELKELNTLCEIITEQGYEIEKADIRRLFRLGFDRYEIIADGFIRKYLEDQEKDDKDIQRNLTQYLEKKGYGKMSDKETNESDESDESEETETTKIFEEIIRMDLKKMGYNVEITEIERIRKFGVTAKIITTYEFMKKYLSIWNLEDEDLDKQILQWRVENTKECERCEIEKLKKEFKIEKDICVECEEDTEKENPLDEKSGEKKDIKGPEIGSSGKAKSKEKNKKPKEIPITPVIPIKLKTIMAASRNELRADIRTFVNAMYNHDIGADWNNLALPPVTLTGLQGEIQNNTNTIGNLNANRGAIVEIPPFYGTSGEDPEEWASKFEETFTANGLGNDDAQRFRIAKAKLMGGAADWLKTEGVNIVDWN
ncbi:hypothetical protein RhiirA4_483928, partial [Rhizophagus irregularis]